MWVCAVSALLLLSCTAVHPLSIGNCTYIYESTTSWTTCSPSCGPGTQVRDRTCGPQSAQPSHCLPCVNITEEQNCTTPGDPPSMSTWTSWTVCDVLCGPGERMRDRFCVDADCPDGTNCTEPNTWEIEDCNNGDPPSMSTWTSWTSCDSTCGPGEKMRDRFCVDADCPDGTNCTEPNTWEMEACNSICCIEPRYWGMWSGWSSCSETCGYGTARKTRTCMDTDCPGDTMCDGPSAITKRCLIIRPEPPHLTTWTSWSSCSETCGLSYVTRDRMCVPNACPDHTYCTGPLTERRYCDLDCCPEAPYWLPWSGWSACSVTCGVGLCTRQRDCEDSICPDHTDCSGDDFEEEFCHMGNCVGCDDDHRTRLHMSSRRIDVSVEGPSHIDDINDASEETDGSIELSKSMTDEDVLVIDFHHPVALLSVHISTKKVKFVTVKASTDDDDWEQTTMIADPSTWTTSWLEPTPAPVDGVTEIKIYFVSDYYRWYIQDLEIEICENNECQWLEWSPYTMCDRHCGEGHRRSHKDCMCMPRSDPYLCEEDRMDRHEDCYIRDCDECEWSTWDSWDACSNDCGGGYRTSRRDCRCPDHYGYDERMCYGANRKTELCNDEPCDQCEWSSWGNWTDCSYCRQTGSRKCHCPTNTSMPCEGDDFYTTTDCCERHEDCEWSTWNTWGSCNRGMQTSSRHQTCGSSSHESGESSYSHESHEEQERARYCQISVAIVNKHGDCLDRHFDPIRGQDVSSRADAIEEGCCNFIVKHNDEGGLGLYTEEGEEVFDDADIFDEDDSAEDDPISIEDWSDDGTFVVIRDNNDECLVIDDDDVTYSDDESLCASDSAKWKLIDCEEIPDPGTSGAETRDLAIAGVVLGSAALAVVILYIIYNLVM